MRQKLTATIALLAACSSSPTMPEDTWRAQLDAARNLWQQNSFSDYSFTYLRQCFCPQLHLRVTVVDGNIFAIADVTADTLYQSPFPDYTILGLFDRIDEIIDSDPDRYQAEYAATTGMPLSVSVDQIIEAVDDEHGFTVLELNIGNSLP